MVNKILQGDSLTVLNTLSDKSIQTCVTSPPYFGLRDYGVEGQIGLESSVEDYVEKLVQVFREVKRVLKDDGVLWLNLGDSYAGSGKGRNADGSPNPGGYHQQSHGQITGNIKSTLHSPYLKSKDLIGVPWKVAFALQKDGWYLRSDIIWHKPNPMPESVKDRPTKAHEYIFLLSKSPHYYYDIDSIKEPAVYGTQDIRGSIASPGPLQSMRRTSKERGGFKGKHGHESFRAIRDTRNKRSVWTVSTRPFKEAHFATFPKELIEPCILAGSRRDDMILDPFFGSGTVGYVAMEHDRNFIGIELNPSYVQIAKERLAAVQTSFI
ncbi:site-specific DNA-methyltransferase [Thalassobacillus sp. CUG 92003]|uniref:DNA-methyltransferase n=1 Tax=Thalassobacillus sp. CUG 92003 TaxID=2736641 RepID=UPI0015E7D9D3|nr:site-specific DNA-methyltransferase [Thalassobacillus sp. CUG 92003]